MKKLNVSEHSIIKAVRSLPPIEALALLRAAYSLSLNGSKQKYELIMKDFELTENYKRYLQGIGKHS